MIIAASKKIILFFIFFSLYACNKSVDKELILTDKNAIYSDCTYRLNVNTAKINVHINKLTSLIGDDSNEEMLVLRGLCFRKNNEFEKSIKDFTKVISLNGNSVALAHEKRGYNYRDLKMPKKSLLDFSKAIKIYKDKYNISSWYLFADRAHLYLDSERYNFAIDDYNAALNILKKNRACGKQKCQGYSSGEVEIYEGMLIAYDKLSKTKSYKKLLREMKERNPGAKKGPRGLEF